MRSTPWASWRASNLGVVAREQGRPEEAHALHEEALALFQAVHGAPGVADALRNLALVAREQGDTERAAALARASLDAWHDGGEAARAASSLGALASVR